MIINMKKTNILALSVTIIIIIILLVLCYYIYTNSDNYFTTGKHKKIALGKPILKEDVKCSKNGIPKKHENGELYKLYNDYTDIRGFNKEIQQVNKNTNKNQKGPKNIFIMRHAEKTKPLYALNENGIYRSTILPEIINIINKKGFPIDYIVTTNPKVNKMHEQQTVTLASWLLNIPIYIFGSQRDVTVVTEEIYTNEYFNGVNILIVFEHTCIQSLTMKLIEKGVQTKQISNYHFTNPLDNSKIPYWNENNYNSIFHLDNNLGFHVWNIGLNPCLKSNNKLTFGKKQICEGET